MKKHGMIFKSRDKAHAERGGALTELLLSLALAVAMLPFILHGQESRVRRAENIVVARDMESVRSSLERYMDDNKKKMLSNIGREIWRVKLSDLADYGISPDTIEKYGDRFQMRVIKSPDRSGSATLQGILVMDVPDITPMRTREIASLGGAATGFVDGDNIYGTFGTWRARTGIFGDDIKDGISESTKSLRETDDYIWRLPSDDVNDATFRSNLSMGGRDVIGSNIIQAKSARIESNLSAEKIGTDKLLFNTRPTIDGRLSITGEASVMGGLSADARDLEVAGTLTLAESARFSNISAEDIWVNNLSLSGISVQDTGRIPIMSVGRVLDMTGGRVDALLVNVGFSGSIAPRIAVHSMIQDDANSRYYWDLSTGVAELSDMSFSALGQLMRVAISENGRGTTEAFDIMSRVAANQNATVSDFINAINQIKGRVTSKFHLLDLE